jgi:uncharacterized membrane protein
MPTLLRNHRQDEGMPNVLLLLVTLSAIGLFASAVARHELFNSSGDLAFFDQGVYLLSQGKLPVASILGFHLLADHAAWILYFVALLYKLYPSIYWLFAIQAGALALGAIPTYWLARQGGLNPKLAITLVAVYLLYPVLYNSNLADFHPDVIAVPALLMAIYTAKNQKLVGFCLSVAVVLGCKAILSLTVVGLGLWLFFSEKRKAYGIIAITSGIAWFLIANQLIIPALGNAAALVNRHHYRYSYFGDSISETLQILVTQPQIFLANLFSSLNFEYLVLLFIPVIWGLRWPTLTPLIAAIPCVALNLLSDHASQKNVVLHYSLPVVPFLIVALIGGLATGKTWLRKPQWIIAWALVGFLCLGKFWLFTSKYLRQLDNLSATRSAIQLVAPQASVLTTDFISPHLTHRPLIRYKYDKNEDLGQFETVLINLRHPGWAASAKTYQQIVQQLRQRPDYILRYQQEDVVLFVKKSS